MRAGKILRPALVLVLLLSLSLPAAANNAASVWASVQFNKRSVVVGEPLLVTITVYTSTWFTQPPEFSEIQVPGAIMVEYRQRTGSMRKTIGNKTYPAIEKKYLVYPLKAGENRLPSMTIVVESPPEGDYKSKRREIRSAERTFQVNSAPGGVEMEQWLTAYDVRIIEHWSRTPENLKQGDVLERRISIEAKGALAALIPPLEMEEVDFGNLYPGSPELGNVQNQSSFTGTRTETWTYLLESEGTFALPGIFVSWFDPVSGKVESSGIGNREIHIAANPDMDFLLSMQDSLQAMMESGEEPGELAFQWMGLNWWQLLSVILVICIIPFLLFRLIRLITTSMRERKAEALDSEEHFFKEFLKVCREGEPGQVMRALHSWYDRYRLGRFSPVFGDFICSAGDTDLDEQYKELEGILYGGTGPDNWSGRKLGELLSMQRRKYDEKPKGEGRDEFAFLNPRAEERESNIKGE